MTDTIPGMKPMATTDDQIHRELASLSPQIVRMLQDVDRTKSPEEIWSSIPKIEKNKYLKLSEAKNGRVWEILIGSIVADGLYSTAQALGTKYKIEIPERRKLFLKDYVADYYDKHGLEFVKLTTGTDVKKLKSWCWNQSSYGDKPLLDQPNLAYIVDGGRARMDRIKYVEMHRATMAGGQGFMKDAGFGFCEWISMRDDQVRPSHRENDGEVREIGESFPSGESYPGESSIGCRCHLDYS